MPDNPSALQLVLTGDRATAGVAQDHDADGVAVGQ
jgi:hypothetical protein